VKLSRVCQKLARRARAIMPSISAIGGVNVWRTSADLSEKNKSSRRLMESLLEKVEERANDMHDLLSRFE
jgi:hypothetical protein